MDTSELDRLIVENLADLDGAAKRIVELEMLIWQQIADLLDTWAKQHRWRGQFDIDEDLWVAPSPQWFEEGEKVAWFQIGWGPEDTGEGVGEEPYFDLARLTGAAGGRLSLWFRQEGVGAREWKPIIRGAGAELTALGFTLSEKSRAFTDCTPDTALIADAVVSEDFSEALAPVEAALDHALGAWKAFDKLRKRAMRQ